MGTEPDFTKEQFISSHIDAGGEIQGAVEGEEGRALTFFFGATVETREKKEK